MSWSLLVLVVLETSLNQWFILQFNIANFMAKTAAKDSIKKEVYSG